MQIDHILFATKDKQTWNSDSDKIVPHVIDA